MRQRSRSAGERGAEREEGVDSILSEAAAEASAFGERKDVEDALRESRVSELDHGDHLVSFTSPCSLLPPHYGTAAHAPARPTAPRALAARAVLLPQSTPVASSLRPPPQLPLQPPPPTDRFVRLFRHFDNLEQVEVERAAGVEPRLGGGHEHIHRWRSRCLAAMRGVRARARITSTASRIASSASGCTRCALSRASPTLARIEMRIFRRAEVEEALPPTARGATRARRRWARPTWRRAVAIGGADVYWKCAASASRVGCAPSRSTTCRCSASLGRARRRGAVGGGGRRRRRALGERPRHRPRGNYVYGNIHDLPPRCAASPTRVDEAGALLGRSTRATPRRARTNPHCVE